MSDLAQAAETAAAAETAKAAATAAAVAAATPAPTLWERVKGLSTLQKAVGALAIGAAGAAANHVLRGGARSNGRRRNQGWGR